MLLENLVSGGVTLVSIIGVFAFFLSIVVQLTKDFVPKKFRLNFMSLFSHW